MATHLSQHRKGTHLLLNENGEDYLLGAAYTCRMTECSEKFKHMFKRFAAPICEKHDDVLAVDLHSTRELRRFRERGQLSRIPYASLLMPASTIRPTITTRQMLVSRGRKSYDDYDIKACGPAAAWNYVGYQGVSNGVLRINRPEWLKAESPWQYITTVTEEDMQAISEEIAELGFKDGKLVGRARNMSIAQMQYMMGKLFHMAYEDEGPEIEWH